MKYESIFQDADIQQVLWLPALLLGEEELQIFPTQMHLAFLKILRWNQYLDQNISQF